MTAQNQAVEKQPAIINRFKQIIADQHLSHAYLLTGNSGIGKKEVALWVAMRLFCTNLTQDNNPCGICNECQRILNGDHPDVVEIKPDGQSIKVDQVRFLKSEFSKSGVEGSQKIFIIEQADKMTASAANSLLKFIEEPVGQVHAFLLTENKNLMLPTIISRTEVIELNPLKKAKMISDLVAQGVSENIAKILVQLTDSPTEMKQMMENDWIIDIHKNLNHWFEMITRRDMNAFVVIQTKIMPLAHDRFLQLKIFDLVAFYLLDVLEVKFKQQQIIYQDIQSKTNQLADQIDTNKVLALMDIVLPLSNGLKQNINFQGLLEQATIKMCNLF